MSDATVLHKFIINEFKMIKQFLWVEILKRQWKNNDSDLDKFTIKMLKIILMLAALKTDNAQSISTSLIYVKAVRDLIWEKMWKNVIKTELIILAVSDT